MIRPSRRLSSVVVFLAMGALSACGGGGDGSSNPTGPKTCATDPGLCPDTTTKTVATLSSAAQARGRYFGAAVDALFTNQAIASAYYVTLGKEFGFDTTRSAHGYGMIVPGNFMKWEPLRRDGRFAAYRYQWGDSLVSYAASHGMKVRGHNLAWYQQNPTWLTNGGFAPDTLLAILADHITNVVTHYRGKIYAWDVVNEALNDGDGSLRSNPPWGGLGQPYIDLAFKTARAADPNALLFYNDYNLEYPGAKQDAAFAMLSSMKARGIPVDGIGFQGHIQINADGTGNPGKQSLISTFNRFAALSLKIEVTELDVRVQTTSPNPTSAALTAQSQAYSDIVGACLAVTACDAIVVWGIPDSESWINTTFPGWGQALLFDGNYNKKSVYNAVLSALQS